MKTIAILSLFCSSLSFASCKIGLETFTRVVHPILRSKCASCHDDGGIGPAHSSQDVVRSYDIAKSSIDFNDIENSYFITMVEMEHWKSDDPDQEGISAEHAIRLVKEWHDQGEKSCESISLAQRSEKKIVNVLSDEKDQTVRFKLNRFLGDDAIFEINVQKRNDDAITVRAPRITSRVDASLEGFYILINGVVNQLENTFSALKEKILKKSFVESELILPGKLLSRSSMAVLAKQSEELTLEIAYQGLSSAQVNLECINPEKMSAVKQFSKQNCFSCHRNKESDAGKRVFLDMDNLCLQFSERINKEAPGRSALLSVSSGNTKDHPKLGDRLRLQFQKLIAFWIK